jgi:protein FrlC
MTPPRFACVTSLFKYYPLPEALREIAEAGCTGLELWGGMPHAYTEDFYLDGHLDERAVAAGRRLIEESGLSPVQFLPEQCFYPVNFLIDEAPPFDAVRLRARSVAYFERALYVAAGLGFPRMAVTTPFWGWSRNADGTWTHRAKQDLQPVIDTFGHLAERAEKLGLELALEPLAHLETTGVETLDELTAVLDGVGAPNLKVMLDTGHVHVTASSLGRDSTKYWREHVDALGKRLVHVHLSDNEGDLDAHLLPGEGSFDFASAFRALETGGYSGWLSAELLMFGANPVPPAAGPLVARTVRYCRDLIDGGR